MAATTTKPDEPGVAVSPPGPGDETLVKRLQAGDRDAGSILVERHTPALLGYLRRLCGGGRRGDQLAEELHQAVWLSAVEHLDQFDATGPAGGFKAWLFRIATNKANDHWRRGGRERVAHAGLRLVAELAVDDPDRLMADERARRVAEAVAKLPEPQREVLLMRYYGDLKFAEIAQIVGCPLNTALGRMHKAMNKLKTMLAETDA